MHWPKWFLLAVSTIVYVNKSVTRSNITPTKSNISWFSSAIPACSFVVFMRSFLVPRILRRVSNVSPVKDREKSPNPWWILSTNTTMVRNNSLASRSNHLVFNVMRSRLPAISGLNHRHRRNERQLYLRRINLVLEPFDNRKLSSRAPPLFEQQCFSCTVFVVVVVIHLLIRHICV